VNEQLLRQAKEGLAGRWEGPAFADLRVLTDEPLQAPALPLLTIQTRGFIRAQLDDEATVQGRIRDPLGGRTWVLNFDIRIWVRLTDAAAAQTQIDELIPRVVTALEEDRSLGGFADDAAISSGETAIVRPREGEPVFVVTLRCAVETTENL
jgi:hypothetical protein